MNKNLFWSLTHFLMPVNPATQEAKILSIMIWCQSEQEVSKSPSYLRSNSGVAQRQQDHGVREVWAKVQGCTGKLTKS